MSDWFDYAVNVVLDHEGPGYVADDNGRGPSKWGITYETAAASGFMGKPEDIANLTRTQAAGFYRIQFWNPSRLYRISDRDLATKTFDLCVNLGSGTAIKMLQEAANDMGASLSVDGVLGPATGNAINLLDPEVLLAGLRTKAEAHYRNLAASNPMYAKNLDGWLARLNS